MESLGANPVTAYLGLGSNVGSRGANLERALEMLDSTRRITLARCSSIYETEPWGLKEQPSFLNAAVEIQTNLEPGGLLAVAKAIEDDMGRVTTARYGPRNIDIDILLYGSLVIDWQTRDLQIPPSQDATAGLCTYPTVRNRWRRLTPDYRKANWGTGCSR